MTALESFIREINGFHRLGPREQIRLFAWHLHVHEGVEVFGNDAIRKCFRQTDSVVPDVSVYLPRMAGYKPPDLLKHKGGYKLSGALRSELDRKYGGNPSSVRVSKLLSDLPERVPNITEREFLQEALSCYRVQAYRACIVMTWNLAFDHLLRWMLSDSSRTGAFNAAILKRFPKKTGLVMASVESFEELKESEVIEVCQTASLLSKNTIEILREKLKRRNLAAHPSQIAITQPQADDVVTDLVVNVVLALS